ncbi:MAG TPA: KEOPS complex subunit Pcc1 [archaeon]|nr:KEOPS complex subunit Pcc1 [archaeon]
MPSLEKEFIFTSPFFALAVQKAVSVELDNTFERRAKSSIHTNKNVVLLKVVAEDESALAASLGFYSRLFGLCSDICVLRR